MSEHVIQVTDDNGVTVYKFNNAVTIERCLQLLQGAAEEVVFQPHKPAEVVVKARGTKPRLSRLVS